VSLWDIKIPRLPTNISLFISASESRANIQARNFLFQVGKLKFITCNLMGNFEWNKVKNQDKKDNLKKSFQPSNRQ